LPNGSVDRTAQIAEGLAAARPDIRLVTHDRADYGAALRAGILAARGDVVVCDEIDLCDLDFHDRALAELETDPTLVLVVGSKTCAGARDRRPWLRRAATRTMTALLRVGLGFRGTDTHGLKAFRREALLPIVSCCVLRRDLFASELVVRAARSGLTVREIPIDVRERRPPARGVLRRVPDALWNLARLFWVVRVRGL
jgi:glycosyltransferase involved in cell wall biosynthesis